jgi:hypothetical protein
MASDPMACHKCPARGAWQVWTLQATCEAWYVCEAHVLEDLKNIGRGKPFAMRGVPGE